jgi:hypothetical protein
MIVTFFPQEAFLGLPVEAAPAVPIPVQVLQVDIAEQFQVPNADIKCQIVADFRWASCSILYLKSGIIDRYLWRCRIVVNSRGLLNLASFEAREFESHHLRSFPGGGVV